MNPPERVQYQDIRVLCLNIREHTGNTCGHKFIAKIPVMIRIEATVAAMNAIRCPSCGGGPRKLFIGGDDEEEST